MRTSNLLGLDSPPIVVLGYKNLASETLHHEYYSVVPWSTGLKWNWEGWHSSGMGYLGEDGCGSPPCYPTSGHQDLFLGTRHGLAVLQQCAETGPVLETEACLAKEEAWEFAYPESPFRSVWLHGPAGGNTEMWTRMFNH